MQLTEADLVRIPLTNLRVPRADFVTVWAAAERLSDEQGRRGLTDWYAGGVAVTCRWLATVIVRPDGRRWYPARSPISERTDSAYEELIEAEFVAAEKLDMRRPRPAWLLRRPGWIEAICATLRWAWRHEGPPPLRLDESAVG